jgi:hypothetical protein
MSELVAVDRITHASLDQLRWQWGDSGVTFTVVVNGQRVPVFLPLQEIWRYFAEHFPMRHSVGCTQSAIGFWGAIKRAARSVSRGIKRVARRVIPKAVQRAAASVARVAKRVVTTVAKAATSDIATYALMGVALIPGMAPAAAGLLAAQQALKRIDVGIAAAKKIAAGIRATPQLIRDLKRGNVAKNLVQTAARNALTGKPVAAGFLNGVRQIASGAAR